MIRMKNPVLRFDVLSLFPKTIEGFTEESILGKAIDRGLLELNSLDLRRWAKGKHREADDRPFGGGAGMVLKPEPLFEAIEEIVSSDPDKVNYLLFLTELKKMSASYPEMFPVKYSDILTDEQGKTRFTSKEVNINFQNIAKNHYDEFGEQYFLEALNLLDTSDYFGVEEVANAFDLIKQANDLRRRRLEQIGAIKKWLLLGSDWIWYWYLSLYINI